MAKEAELARSTEIDRQNTLYQLQERSMNAQQRHQLELLTYGTGDEAAQRSAIASPWSSSNRLKAANAA